MILENTGYHEGFSFQILRYPYLLVTNSMPPQKINEDEYNKKRRLQSYFFRSVCTTLAECSGIDEHEARYELQKRYLRTGEIVESESGTYDVVWKDEELKSFEDGKRYIVRSIGDLSVKELSELVDKSKNYILITWGVNCPEYQRKFKTKEV